MSHRLFNLDLLRGLAALLVCAGHLRAFLFVDFDQIEAPGIFARLFYFATGLGHQSVVVFFVLSGYLVGGSVLTAYQSDRWSWAHYILRRMTRLWVVLLPALVTTFILDSLGRHWGNRGYDGSLYAIYSSGPTLNTTVDLRATTFLANVCFLQTIQTNCYGTNGPLWSLANEFWYYVLFPLLCGIWFTLRSPVRNVWSVIRSFSFALLFALLLWWLPSGLLWAGLIWLLGVGAFWAGRQEFVLWIVRHPVWLLGAGAMSLGTLAASKTGSWLGTDYSIGIAFALWIAGLAATRHQPSTINKLASRFSDMSYTLYLVHFPVLAFVFFGWFGGKQVRFGVGSCSLFWALLLGTVAIAAGVWFCFERNTDRLRKLIEPIFFGGTADLPVVR